MRWTILAMGKLKEPHWRAAADEYLKRLRSYRPIEVQELTDERADPGDAPARVAQVKGREAERILEQLKPGTRMVALWERGLNLDSVQLARRLAADETEGGRELAFVIGGANGLDARVLDRADWCLSLSSLTFPHQLARVVLLEQLYRVERILRQEPYHK
ncbi:MAG: 23S rRNA (pseudouridine(1915)-N(3))-methyltransferase RlmH [Candidatus Sericytochromatia bacterium]|nr:23S rRNA (pseudouridine(1915)-N(3))-methyltransferase RlmH [Candidatus Sericytochromatia bacterium]